MNATRCAVALLALVTVNAAPAPLAARSAPASRYEGTAAVADAAMAGDKDAVRALLKQGSDVNGAQGDGITALHWAARKGDAELASVLIRGGANVQAATRLAAYTPLHMAAEAGSAAVVAALVKAAADVNAATTTGTTALMLAAASGDTDSIKALLDGGAKPNLTELDRGHTALMFAAAANRVAAVKLLLARGADPMIATKVVDLAALSKDGSNNFDGRNLPGNPNGRSGGNAERPASAPAPKPRTAGVERQFLLNELVGAQGGMTPLLFAARQGYSGDGERAARRGRRRERGESGGRDEPASDRDAEWPVRSRQGAARSRRESQPGRR